MTQKSKSPLQKTVEDAVKNEKFLSKKDTINYACQACGKCCYNQDILISPIDMIKFRRAFNMPTMSILQKYVSCHQGGNSKMPMAVLKFLRPSPDLPSICPLLKPVFEQDLINLAKELKHKYHPELMAKCKGDCDNCNLGSNEVVGKEDVVKEELAEFQKEAQKIVDLNVMAGNTAQRCSIQNNKPEICKLYPMGRAYSYEKDTGKRRLVGYFQQDKKSLGCPDKAYQGKVTLQEFLDKNQITPFEKVSGKYQDWFMAICDIVMKIPGFDKNCPDYLLLQTYMYNFDALVLFYHKVINDKAATTEDKFRNFTGQMEMTKILGDTFPKLPQPDKQLFANSVAKNATDQTIIDFFEYLMDTYYQPILKDFKKKYGKISPPKQNKTKS